VHVPADGNPLKGYELARADVEKRGNGDGASIVSMPSLFARLFGSKSDDEEDEGPTAPIAREKAAPAIAVAKTSEPVPMPRSKPVASTLQLASADAQIVQGARSKPTAAAEKAEAKPLTPADIINARGFWGDTPAAPKQASLAQVADVNARQAVASTDPQSTASVPAAYQAMAYAPAPTSPADRPNVVAASAPIPRGAARPAAAPRNPMAVTNVTTVVAKGAQGQGGAVATATRIAASRTNDVWMRVMILAPSASTSMSTTMLGDANMSLLSAHFVKPQAVVAMGFSDDPLIGLSCDRFSGAAIAPLATQTFVLRTASLR
jgi:hypothetical protein